MKWWQTVPEARAIGDVPDITNLTHDSRLAGPAVAFGAIPGGRTDGHEYLESVLSAGAAAAVVQADREPLWASFAGRLPLVVVPDTRAVIARLAAAVHGEPSQTLRLVGITGTDGKTTTSHLTSHVLSECGLASGYLTSVGFETGRGFQLNASHMTTVEGTTIQSMLAEALANGRQTMVVEASSEGLAQHRLEGCHFDVAVFTNLTRDHLDFHGTMQAYLEAKGRLFEMLGERVEKPFPQAAVLNADDEASAYLNLRARAHVLTYGLQDGVDFQAQDVREDGLGFQFTLRSRYGPVLAKLPLTGRFNVLNALAAVAAASSQGVEVRQAVAALASFPGVPGRLERIDCGQPFRVIVDIASTPAALENVLTALRPATTGRLVVVFGAAGGRDPARRSGMGEVAARLADFSVLTNEDPRDEVPTVIIGAISDGLSRGGRRAGVDYVIVPDRREAIAYAFSQAGPDDTVLLAGKATETSMVFDRGRTVPWDERETARELLRGR